MSELKEKKAEEVINRNYIKEISIKNFKLFRDFKLNNLSAGINIITGKNETGKTTLLQAITLGCLGYYQMEIDTRTFRTYGNVNHEYTLPTVNISLSNGKEIKTKMRGNRLEGESVSKDFFVLSYGANLFTKTGSFPRNIEKIITKGEEECVSAYSIFPDYSKAIYITSITDPLIIAWLLNKDIPVYKEVLNIYLKILNSFLNNEGFKEYKMKQSMSGFSLYDNQENEYGLSNMGNGYYYILLLVSDIIVKILSARKKQSNTVTDAFKNASGVIMIDNIDNHLHPALQRIFLSKLFKLLPNIQFFVTTHSPVVLQSAEGETAIKLEKNEIDKIIAKVEKIKYGYNLEIINNYYFSGKTYGKATNKEINNLNKLKKSVLINREITDFEIFKKQAEILLQKNISEKFSSLINYDISYLQNFIKKNKTFRRVYVG